MGERTMVYRPATPESDPAKCIERDGVSFEWMIVDLEDGGSAPAGWSLGMEAETAEKPKRGRKPKSATDVSETDVTEPDGDGNSN